MAFDILVALPAESEKAVDKAGLFDVA